MPNAPQIDLRKFYTPHAGQKLCHDNPAKVKVLQVARRWGKGRFALFEMLHRYLKALGHKAPSHLVPPWHAWIVVPSFPQARQTWNELLALVPPVLRHNVQSDDMLIYLAGSDLRPWGLVEVKSAYHLDTLQTVGLDFLWIQEAQDIPDAAFEKLLPTTRSPDREGRAVFEGIPSLYADHWFRRVFVQAEEGRADYFAYQATYKDNPFLAPQQIREIDSDRELVREAAWRRMYLAEFSESAGYFQRIDRAAWGDELLEPVPGRQYVAGLDLGRKVDPSVLTICDKTERRVACWRVWDAGQNWVIQREAIHQACVEWNVERLICDSTGIGDVIFQELQEMGLPVEPYQFTAASRDHLLNSVAVSLERSTLSFPPDRALLRQLRAFSSRRTVSGTVRTEVPQGEHDDHVFSVGLALEACDPGPSLSSSYGAWRPMRYVPTQQDAENGTMGKTTGARIMADRLRERMAKRIEQAMVSEA
jgi:hypothetical protein